MVKTGKYLSLVLLIGIGLAFATADAQENLAQEVSAILQQSCLICHGPHGPYTEELVIQSSQELIDTGKVIPGNPDDSVFYQRLIETAVEKRMPLGQPPLPPAAIQTIRQWIQVGAPDWNAFARTDIDFITTEEMLQTIENHVASLDPFDRSFARYFTSTHLYNAGEDLETLNAYQRALSKLVNSLSWGREVTKPQPIDSEATIFYIDLRDYEWEIGTNRWTLIETEYPYKVAFDAPTQTALHQKLTNLRQEMNCEVPFVHVDWFLSTASLPPLYHDILDLPLTDRELETRLEVNVVENIRNAPGRRVWRAGFNNSRVSKNNRVVERHRSRYGAYWKSYDFAGSVGTQNIFTHPLNFTHDGGEIIFNLPNGLQAYYLADAGGNRLDAAPPEIVQNPATSDSTVRNGLSCIGCHTEGMKPFEDEVRSVVEQNENPPFDKDSVLRLYVEKTVMDALIEEDTDRYRQALEATGDIFGGIEPVQRFHEAFQAPLSASDAAAAVGLETEVFLGKIRGNVSLQNLGLQVLANGTVKRDAWTSNFDDVISALNTPDSTLPPVVQRPELIPGESVNIPDPNLRAAIAEALGKGDTTVVSITAEEMATLNNLVANDRSIRDLTGLEYAINALWFTLERNQISDLSPLAGLENINALDLAYNQLSDLSPLSGLINLIELSIYSNPDITDLSPLVDLKNLTDIALVGSSKMSDLSPLAGLVNLKRITIWGSPISNLLPLSGLTQLERLNICGADAPDIAPLAKLTGLKEVYLVSNGISDVSPLSDLTNLTRLSLEDNNISDISPLAALTNLKWLGLHHNSISDFSPLAGLPETTTISRAFNPGVPTGGPKIEGPWLWVTVPGERLDDDNTDLLAEASAGTITEQQVATNGVIQGKSVGKNLWTQGKIAPSGETNIIDMLDEIGSEANTDDNRIIYGSVILESPHEQNTNMFFGWGDLGKIWLNGELIYQSLIWRRAGNYHDFFSVTLKQGTNVLLVVIDDWEHSYGWSGFFGFEEGTEYTVSTVSTKARVGYVFSKSAIHVDDTFTLDLNAEEVADLAGWQFDIAFDPAVLEAVEVNEGDFLKEVGRTTFFQGGTIDNTTGKITGLSTARISESGVSGTGTLLSVTFKAKADGETQITLENFELGAISGDIIPSVPPEIIITVGDLPPWDVNQDGRVSVLDLILVAKDLGVDTPINLRTDVNRDGIINIQDLIIVAQHLGESTDAAAPSVIAAINNGELTPAMVQAWIAQAQIEDDGSIAFRQGIANLEQLLTLFIPEETALLHNYPNPFNPETWIPYQLAESADVTLTIHSVNGTVVRTLTLGYQPAGIYQTRSRAAYWDGKNEVGEPVASGVYFYTLTAGDFNATRKMLIRK